MFRTHWLARVLGRKYLHGAAGKPPRKGMTKHRPCVELLEDRCLLAAVLVQDIRPGSGSGIDNLTPVGQRFVDVGGTLFFPASDGVNGFELWKSDGTTAGTVLVKNINPGPVFPGGGSSNPSNLFNMNGTLFFTANDGTHGFELWKSDGTEAGTVMVKDIAPGPGSGINNVVPAYLTDVNGTLFFMANARLWKSDGTAEGTVQVSAAGFSWPEHLTNVNGTLFFFGDNGSADSRSHDLWKSDGTAAGTVLVKTHVTHTYTPASLNGRLFFASPIGLNIGLWASDGTAAGTVPVKNVAPWTMTVINETLFFSVSGSALWKSDGTADGTVPVRGLYPKYLTNVNGTLFFMAYSSGVGEELWKSDGTEAGTVLVKDISPGTAYSSPMGLVNVNGLLYFNAKAPGFGRELWRSDGTADGTVLVQDIRPGGSDGFPNHPFPPVSLTNVGGKLFFTADDGVHGYELWVVAPSPTGQPPVLNLIPDQTIDEGGMLTFGVTAADPDPDDALTYSLVDAPAGASIDPVTGVFTWTPDDGPTTVSVTVRVTDALGLSDTRSFTVTVLNVAPTAGITGPTSGAPGQALSFTLSATDPSAADQAAGFTYVIDWGDGSPLQTISAFPGSGSGVTVSHAYALPGAYVVQVSAIDKDGGAGTAMLTEPVMIASVPVGVSDLSWSGGGILAPPEVAAGQSFTIARTFAVGGEPVGPFSIAYWASVDDIFGNEDDFLVGVELIDGAAPGIHSGTSPAFTIGVAGSYFLFAVLDSDGQVNEIDEGNNVVMALFSLLVSELADDEE